MKENSMIQKWFIDDIQRVLSEHRYIVVTDARGEGYYLLNYLPQEYMLIAVKDEWGEIEAKYLAESKYRNEKVVFYAKKKAEKLTFLQEYVQTAGLLALDDMEAYIRQKLFDATGKNTTIAREKLLLAGKLSEGKDLKWWISIAEGITEPLNMKERLLPFLYAPIDKRKEMDDTLWNVFRDEVYNIIGKTPTEQPADVLAHEVVNVMFQRIVDNTIEGLLLDVYYQWADSAEKVDVLRKCVESYTLNVDIDALEVHPDHPFDFLDRKLMKQLSNAIKSGQDTTDIVKYIQKRSASRKAKVFKPQWLSSVLTLCTFEMKDMNDIDDYTKMAEFYMQNFSMLDTAMRKIYVAWLNDEPTLRPLQEHYTQLNKELLTKWYSLNGKYTPTQAGIVANALEGDKRTAVIVCDGLRLEIAECVAKGLTDKDMMISRNVALAVLPSVTENGMSALYGCKEPTTNAQARFANLKKACPDVEILPLGMIGESTTAKKLVLTYGDIDEVGEKKQMGGLKDIDNYETELREKAKTLFRLGYEKVVLTTDHGFVITGILDEADKEPRPNGQILKIEERFVLTEHPLASHKLIEMEGRYFDSNYQYYAKTDKPFVTKGKYGYSHGGFTPQECIIPVYELTKKNDDFTFGIAISNKSELRNITGNYFTVKLKADKCDESLFTQKRKIKVMLFAGNKLADGNALHTMKPGDTFSQEYEWSDGIDKVVITDKETAAQIDSCEIRKSSSRDIDDLF